MVIERTIVKNHPGATQESSIQIFEAFDCGNGAGRIVLCVGAQDHVVKYCFYGFFSVTTDRGNDDYMA